VIASGNIIALKGYVEPFDHQNEPRNESSSARRLIEDWLANAAGCNFA
jgi:hypothetical protein